MADATGLAQAQILEWVNRADLYRIKGVGSEYSDLLERAGVDTVVELANRNAANLSKAIKDLVGKGTRVVRRIPSDREIASWVAQAKKLPRAVEY
jgi:predicted flap endonuclease-1-like 5' DNA nuclease